VRLALTALFAATVAAASGAAWAQDTAAQAVESIPAGIPLRVQLDKTYRLRVGTKVQGHLTEPVYLFDHEVLPANSKVYGTIIGKHPVDHQTRMAAMFDGDLTPLKEAEVSFDQMETPDGNRYAIQTESTQRTSQVVHIATGERRQSHQSLGRHIVSVFHWARTKTEAVLAAPHKWDTVRQAVYQEIPIHPQELWVGTQYDAELTRPLPLPGQPHPSQVEAADLNGLKLDGTIRARLLDPVDSATAQVGTPIEAVLTEPLFEDAPAKGSAGDAPEAASSATPRKRTRRLLLPEGTHLLGSVVQAKAARMFGRNGSLRLSFRRVELPAGDVRVIQAQLMGAEGDKSERLRIDDEGGVHAGGSNLFAAPASLGALAAVGDRTGAGVVTEAITGNGMDLVTRVAGALAADGGIVSGIGYYEAGKIVYDQWIGRGHEVAFARNTRLEIELAAR
jgi:hypothetical protein